MIKRPMNDNLTLQEKDFEKSKQSAQVMLEFTFSMIIVLLMLYALVMVFQWGGKELIQRQKAHEEGLYLEFDPNYNSIENSPIRQMQQGFYNPASMDAIYVPDEEKKTFSLE